MKLRCKIAMQLLILLLLAARPAMSYGQATKPAQQPAPKPVMDDLYERVQKTLDQAIVDVEDEKSRVRSELLGKGIGEWGYNNGAFVPDFKNKVTQANVYAISSDSLKKLKQNLGANLETWRQGKLATSRMQEALYGAASTACATGYTVRRPLFDSQVMYWEGVHEVLSKDQEISAAADEQLRTAQPPLTYEQRTALSNKTAALLAQNHKQAWSHVLAAAHAAQDRLDKARKRWGSKAWEYYDFAKAKSASPSDGHAAGAQTMKRQLDSLFTMPAPEDLWRSIQISQFGLGGGVDGTSATSTHMNVYFPYAQMDNVDADGKPLWSEAEKWTDPDLQIYHSQNVNSPMILGIGLTLQPSVDKLRGYKEQEDAWSITDTVMVPYPPSQLTPDGRIKPTPVDGSDSYRLFVIGKKLPTKKSELKSIQSLEKGILIEPLAFTADQSSLSEDLRDSWDRGLGVYARGLDAVQKQNLADMPAMLLRVKLTPGIMPGRKRFQINGANGGWFLDQGTSKAEIKLLKEVSDDPDRKPDPTLPNGPNAEEAKLVYPGEALILEIKSPTPIDAQKIELVVGSGKTWSRFDSDYKISATPVSGQPGLFRTPRIKLVTGLDPLLDAANAKSREANTTYLATEPGQSIHATPADLYGFTYDHTQVSVPVLPTPNASLWYFALIRASFANGKIFTDANGKALNEDTLPGQTAKEISNTILSQVVLRGRLSFPIQLNAYLYFLQKLYGVNPSKGDVTLSNKIKIGDQAAMILMRDHFLRMMDDVVEGLDRVNTDDQKIALMRSLLGIPAVANIFVSGPRAVSVGGDVYVYSHPLRRFLTTDWMPAGTDKEGAVRSAFLEGFKKYYDSVLDSRRHAEAISDKDIDALLALTGNHFDNVVADLTPRLMKPVKDSSGTYRWVPDYDARAYVSTLNKTFDAVQAQREYSAIDTQVALAAASLVPVVLPGGIVRTVASLIMDAVLGGSVAAAQFPEYLDRQEEFHFASGAVPVLGADRFYIADLQRTSAWGVMLNVVLSGLSFAGNAEEVFKTLGSIGKQDAAALAVQLAKNIEQQGMRAITNAKPEEAAGFAAEVAGIEAKEAAVGADALTTEQKTIKRAFEKFRKLRGELKDERTSLIPEREAASNVPTEWADSVPVVNTVPTKPEVWTASDGRNLDLEELISDKTMFFNVFKRRGRAEVVKALKAERAELIIDPVTQKAVEDPTAQIWGDIQKARETLENNNIPHKHILDVNPTGEGGYLTQEYLPTRFEQGNESFVVDSYLKRLGPPKAHEWPLTEGLPNEMQDAIVELIREMKEKQIAFEDFKLDNIYIERLSNGRLQAGVMDVDRIAKWGDFTKSMDELTWELENRTANVLGQQASIRPAGYRFQYHQRVVDFEEFWILMLEKRNIVRWDPELQTFISGRINLEKLETVLPGLKRRGIIDLRQRQPVVLPTPPKSGSLLDRLRGFLTFPVVPTPWPTHGFA